MSFTILVRPVLTAGYLKTLKHPELEKEIGRRVLKRRPYCDNSNGYGGHSVYTKSLVESLERIKYTDFNYQPKKQRDIANNVHVVDGYSTLRYAFYLKSIGMVEHVTSSGTVVNFPNEYNYLLCDERLDCHFTPSRWLADAFLDIAPELEGKIDICPCGTDVRSYLPGKRSSRRCLLYLKYEVGQLCWRVEKLLKDFGYEVIVIRYGNYKINEYIDALSKVSFMVAITVAETQGFFLQEAWSMDVPTICYDLRCRKWCPPEDSLAYELFGGVSSCPYLSDESGLRFEDINQLTRIIKRWDSIRNQFRPREYMIKNLSYEVCARKFVTALEKIYEH